MSMWDVSPEAARDVARAWWLFAIVGVASLVAGIILIARPSNSLAVLAVVVGIFLLLDGIVQLISSFGHDVENRALSAILGVLGVVVGIALVRHPFHGVAAIGLLLGIWLVAAGLVRLVRVLAIGAHRLLGVLIALLEVVVGIVIVSDPHIGYTALAILAGIWLVINGLGTIALGIVIRGLKPEPEPELGSASPAAG